MAGSPANGVAPQSRRYKPQLATPPGLHWRPVSVETQVTVVGGFSGTEKLNVNTTEIADHGTFVELNKRGLNGSWLLRACRGKGAFRGCLSRSSLIGELRGKTLSVLSVVTDDTFSVLPEADDDPMNSVAVDFEPRAPTPVPRKRQKRAVLYNTAWIEVDAVPRIAVPGSADKCKVQTAYFHKSRKLYLHVDHLEWLIAYIADELICGGVAVPGDDDEASAVAEANCEVPGLHIEYNFNTNTFDAWFVSGPLVGTRQCWNSNPQNMTIEKWTQLLAQTPCKLHGDYISADNEQLCHAAKLFLEMHCNGLLQGATQPDGLLQGPASSGM